jgi:hypothetical protein
MIENPLFNSSFFVTPESFDDLQSMIDRTYSGSERTVALHVMMFTNNLCHKLFDEAILESKIVRSET